MQRHREKYERVTRGMTLPVERRAGTPENARWFLRSGAIHNCEHPNILLAIYYAKCIAQ